MRTFLLPLGLLSFLLVRSQAGSLDPTFGNGGVQHLQPGLEWDKAWGVAAMADNTLAVCGYMEQGDSSFAVVAHVLNDGSLDAGFGQSGYAITIAGIHTGSSDIVLPPGGGILTVGQTQVGEDVWKVILAKFLSNGTPDPTFGTNGIVEVDTDGAYAFLGSLHMLPDGRFLAAGSIKDANGVDNGIIMRFLANGDPDPTFSGDGKLVITANPEYDQLSDVVAAVDGGVWSAGFTNLNSQTRAQVVKTDADGNLDMNFDGDGLLLPDLGFTFQRPKALLALPDGFLLGGNARDSLGPSSALIARFNMDGSTYMSYAQDGIATVDTGTYVSVVDLKLDDSGRTVFCGYRSDGAGVSDPRDFTVGRLLPDGSPDIGFGMEGVVQTDVRNVDHAEALAIQPDGRIVVAGWSSDSIGDMLVTRYLKDACAVFPEVGPESLVLCPNSTGELTTGTFDSYQWYKNGAEIPGATGQSVAVTSIDDLGSWFKVRTTIDTCFGISDSVLVDGYVFLLPFIINEGDAPNLIGDNGEQIYCQGDDPVLVLGAPYDTNVQWSMNGEPIPGANDTLYAVPGSGSYTVEGAPAVCPDFIQNAGVSIEMDFHPYVQPTIYGSGILLCPQPEGLSSQWYYNGQPVAGFEQCVIPIDAGNYTVFVDYGDSCSVLSAPFYVVGLDEYTRTDLKASPLPTSDRVTITWTEGAPLPDWRVIDVTGRIVRSGSKATSPLTIDLGALDVGRYRFLSGDGRSLPLAVTH